MYTANRDDIHFTMSIQRFTSTFTRIPLPTVKSSSLLNQKGREWIIPKPSINARTMAHSKEFNRDNHNTNQPNKRHWMNIGISLVIGSAIGAIAYKKFAAGSPHYSQSSTGAATNQSVSEDTPGDPMSLKSRLLCTGSNIAQSFAPINSIHLSVCGIHHYAGDIGRQVEAHHFCSHLNEDVHQCVIYDSSQPNARLLGVEYIISKELFDQLPEEEKKLWHSHVCEVKSGVLVAPSIPGAAEDQLMEHLVDTYGKTFHMWQIDRGDTLPLGLPQLMMSVTDPSEIDQQILKRRDLEFDVSTQEKRDRRKSIVAKPVAKEADYYHTRTPDFFSHV
jgi:hypothetical protein